MRNAFFLNPSPGNLFCHLNVVLVFDVFVRSTSAQTFFSSRFVYSSDSLGLIIQMNTKTEEKWRLSLPFLPCVAFEQNRGNFYRNKTQSKEPEKPFSTQTDIRRLEGNKKKGRTKSSTELMLLPREILFIGIMNLEARRASVWVCIVLSGLFEVINNENITKTFW